MKTTLLSLASVLFVLSVHAQEPQEKRYTPPPDTHPAQVYWGDAHIHTRISIDSSLWGNTLGPADTYKFVRGGEVTSFKGWTAKLGRPLDWTVVSDHSDAYGFFQMMERGDPFIVAEPEGVRWHDMIMNGQTREVADEFIKGFGDETLPWDISAGEALRPQAQLRLRTT